MAPNSWLDVHGHFSLPLESEEQPQTLVKQMHDGCFLMPKDWTWSMEDSLHQMDQTGVQMQLLSYLPANIERLKAANDLAASIVKKHPTRFGMLCALPTEDPDACLHEIDRTQTQIHPEGFAVTAIRKDVMLSDPRLDPVWSKLDSKGAVVFSHPNANAPPRDGRPTPLIEVAFETCRVAVDMLYSGIFRRYPNIRFIFAHSGGALPALAGRLELLGAEDWIPNPERLSSEDIKNELATLYVDCAATAATGLYPALQMVGKDHVVYGSDCAVSCSTHGTMLKNRESLLEMEEKLGVESGSVGVNAWKLFLTAAERVETGHATSTRERLF